MPEGYSILKDADYEQSKFPKELKSVDKGEKPVERKHFLNNLGLFLGARKNALNNFKSWIFQI